MEKRGSERRRLLLLGGAAVLCLFLLDYLCPFRYLAGISCPGCGVTRSWLALFRGQLGEAFRLHPLFWLPPIAAVLGYWGKNRPCKVLFWVCIGAFLALWLLRLADPGDTAAVFAPENGWVCQSLRRLWEALFS